MSSARGVTCYQCGASATLPDDLTAPTFRCAYCQAELETARYAGAAAVSADALLGHLQEVAATPGMTAAESVARAPKLVHGSAGTRPAPCRRCGAGLEVPLDVTVRFVVCGHCQAQQPITDYVSDAERLAIDMARQARENEILRRLEAEGLPCGRCGGKTPLRERGAVQVTCAHCGATVLLSDHVDASAVARHRVAAGVFSLRDDLRAQHAAASRRRDLLILAGVAGLIVFFGLAAVASAFLLR